MEKDTSEYPTSQEFTEEDPDLEALENEITLENLRVCPGSILSAKTCQQILFAIVAKEIIEKKLCQKIAYKYRKNRKNNKSNKNQDLEEKKEAKKDPEMSANIAKIATVTRIFLLAENTREKYRKNNKSN